MSFSEARFQHGDEELVGLHMRPTGPARAAVAVFPTFMNSTRGVEAKARALADQGFAVLIGDFYGSHAPRNFEEAFNEMGRLLADPPFFRRRLSANLDALNQLEPDLPKLAIGFCLGGKAVLELARDGHDLLAVTSFHGLLETAIPANGTIPARILVCHGDADSMVPRSHVMGFWEEMDAASASWHFHSYAGVEHGFTNQLMFDGSPNPAYDESADRQSWAAMLGLFDEVLG
ncbi:MAG: dienelactone hydrolase family protein [Sphingomonadales bacterium]|nr:MAG: dienelactone hydrolase family protein [Sphingomonadales bacterium]